jgi:hypothetical protein
LTANKSGPLINGPLPVLVGCFDAYFLAITVMNVMSDMAVPSMPIAVV